MLRAAAPPRPPGRRNPALGRGRSARRRVPPPPRAAAEDDDGGLDPVEKLVAKLFPKAYRADKPFGLDRISVEQFPDQYPSRSDLVNAAPVAGDARDVALFRPLLEQTSLERCRLDMCFDSARDGGFEVAAFRAACEGKGACVVLGKTRGGCLFGGYTAKGWIGLGDERNEVSAFLFCDVGGSGKAWEKLPKVGGGALALLDKPGRGIQFGPDGLRVPLDGRPVAYSRLGTYYAKRAGGGGRGSTLFAPGEDGQAELEWLRVYCDADQKSTARGSFLFGY